MLLEKTVWFWKNGLMVIKIIEQNLKTILETRIMLWN